MKNWQILGLFSLLIISVIFTFHESNAIILCGVAISGGGGSTITNNNPCINVTSVISNSSGITTGVGGSDPNRTYNLYAPLTNLPVTSTWRSQSHNESEWLVTSNYPDTLMKITQPRINKTLLNYFDGTPQTSYNGVVNTVNVYNNKVIQLLFNATFSLTNSSSSIIPPASGLPVQFNNSNINLGFGVVNRGALGFDIFTSNYTTNVPNSYYHGVDGSNTLTKVIGNGLATLTLNCNLSTTNDPFLASNGSNIYYGCTNSLNHVNTLTGVNTHDFSTNICSATRTFYPFITQKQVMMWCLSTATSASDYETTVSGNTTFTTVNGGPAVPQYYSNQQIATLTGVSPGVISGMKMNYNNTSLQTLTANTCNINYNPTNNTKFLDPIACDPSIPAMAKKYWNGMNIQKIGGYNTNKTQPFLNSVDASPYKVLLSMPCDITVGIDPCITFIVTDSLNNNYYVVMTSTNIYYTNAQTAMINIQVNRAFQSYNIVTTSTNSSYTIPNPILQPAIIYGFGLNKTTSNTGLVTLPSGYTMKLTNIQSAIRTLDPRWTNLNVDLPAVSTSGTLFPIFLTVSNAPQFAALKATNPNQLFNSQESLWTVTQLDGTRSAEFDLPPSACANVYVADISTSPYVYNFEGIICATGTNSKTISYTNTLPLTFWDLKYGVTHTYTPQTNSLQTIFHSTTVPTNYTVIVFNSTGANAIVQSFTTNGTLDTRNFNVSGVAKPAELSVRVGGNQVYSAYLGSSLSFASTVAFFHQYLSFQGFDMLSFIPLIFAAMFTRNTVGIGAALVVVLIATLSFLSVVVVPESVIIISIVVAIIGLVGYRGYTAYG